MRVLGGDSGRARCRGGCGRWVNGAIEEQMGMGPLWGAREGNRCALALISLALDEGDATAIGGRRWL
jgi:hypothetical protein